MAIQNIRDPGIRQGFSNLAGLFAPPDPQAAFQAARTELLHRQADEAAYRARNERATQTELSSLFGLPNDQRDPQWRNRVSSAIVGGPQGLELDAGGALGHTVYTEPHHFDDHELSNVLLATGVTSDYRRTPEGQARGFVADMMSGGDGGKNKDVSPTVAQHLYRDGRAALAGHAGVDPDNLDMGEAGELFNILVSEEFSRRGNATEAKIAARERLLNEHGFEIDVTNPWFRSPRATVVRQEGFAPPAVPPSQGGMGQPQEGMAPQQGNVAPEGLIIQHPQTGEMLIKRAGQWVPYE